KVVMFTQAGLATVRFPPLLEITDDDRFTGAMQLLDTSFPVFFRMDDVVVPFASSITLHHDKQPAASLKVVARSTPHSIHMTDDTIDLSLQAWKPRGEWRQFDVAAEVEGKLRSAFDARAVPAGSTGRVFLLASSQFTANPFA